MHELKMRGLRPSKRRKGKWYIRKCEAAGRVFKGAKNGFWNRPMAQIVLPWNGRTYQAENHTTCRPGTGLHVVWFLAHQCHAARHDRVPKLTNFQKGAFLTPFVRLFVFFKIWRRWNAASMCTCPRPKYYKKNFVKPMCHFPTVRVWKVQILGKK